MYSSTDIMDDFLDQYGTNMKKLEDCHLTITPNDSLLTMSEPKPELLTESEPVPDLLSMQLPSS